MVTSLAYSIVGNGKFTVSYEAVVVGRQRRKVDRERAFGDCGLKVDTEREVGIERRHKIRAVIRLVGVVEGKELCPHLSLYRVVEILHSLVVELRGETQKVLIGLYAVYRVGGRSIEAKLRLGL